MAFVAITPAAPVGPRQANIFVPIENLPGDLDPKTLGHEVLGISCFLHLQLRRLSCISRRSNTTRPDAANGKCDITYFLQDNI